MKQVVAVIAALTVACAVAPSAGAAEPKLTVAPAKLASALKCAGDLRGGDLPPIMFVTGTGASGDEGYALGKAAFDGTGTGVCWVNFPNHTTADVQVSVQYLVHGLRTMSRRAGRPITTIGISQGGLLARTALTYWPSLRAKVADVVTMAGSHHGSAVRGAGACGADSPCTPASFQQAAGSSFLRALNVRGRDETPGPTHWTTVRSATDETVRPVRGSALAGATNVLIQDVCPGRKVTHIGTAFDSVTFALILDASTHAGPAKVSRLPADVCAQPYAPGLDPATTAQFLQAGSALTAGRGQTEPRVHREPAVRDWMRTPARG